MDHDIRRLRIDVDNLESNYNSMNYESYYLLTDNNIDGLSNGRPQVGNIVNDDTIEKALQVFDDTLEDFKRSRK